MTRSEYVYEAVMSKMKKEKLKDSQSEFIEIFDIAFKKSFEKYFRQLMLVNNKIEFNSKWILKQTEQ